MLPHKVTYSVTGGTGNHDPASYDSDNGNSTTVVCRVPGFQGAGWTLWRRLWEGLSLINPLNFSGELRGLGSLSQDLNPGRPAPVLVIPQHHQT